MENLIGKEIEWNGNEFLIITDSEIELQIWNEDNDVVYQFERENIPQEILGQIKNVYHGTRK